MSTVRAIQIWSLELAYGTEGESSVKGSRRPPMNTSFIISKTADGTPAKIYSQYYLESYMDYLSGTIYRKKLQELRNTLEKKGANEYCNCMYDPALDYPYTQVQVESNTVCRLCFTLVHVSFLLKWLT